VIVHQRRSPGKLLQRVVELWPHSTGTMMAYCVKQLSFRRSGPRYAVKAAAIAIEILRGTSDDIEPVIRHLLKGVNSPSALAQGGGMEYEKSAHWWLPDFRTRHCGSFAHISARNYRGGHERSIRRWTGTWWGRYEYGHGLSPAHTTRVRRSNCGHQ